MEANIPLVSVIIPLYNHEKYIVECLDSVRDSYYEKIELIVIDDGSSDNSNAVTTSWLENNRSHFVRTVFERQANSGVSKTANRLIGLSQGDIIIPLASDDALLPEGISLRVSFLKNNPHLLAVFADAAMIDGNSAIICRELEKNMYEVNKCALADPRFIVSELILKWSVPGPVFAAWRRAYDTIDGVGMYDESLQAEDRDFYLRLLSRKALGYIPDEVALYRYVQQSLCHDAEKNIVVRQSILRAEKDACKRFCGMEKKFLELVYTKNKVDMLFFMDKKSFTLFLLSKGLEWTVKLAYKLHNLVFRVSSLIAPRSVLQNKTNPPDSD